MTGEFDLQSLADFAVKKALAKGVDQVEAWVERAAEISVTLERNNVASGSSSQFSGMGIRVLRNKSLGFASLNRLTRKFIEQAVDDAIAITRYAPPLEHNYLPEKRPLTSVEVYDPESKFFEVENALDLSLELLNTAKAHDPRVLVDYGQFTASIGSQAISTSEGIEAEEKTSIFIWQLLGMAREGDEVGSYASAFDAATRVRAIDVNDTALDFGKKAVDSLGAKRIASFSGSLLLTPLAAISFILSPILSSSLGDNIQKGRSQFAGREGTQVVSECLELIDDGTISRAIGSGTFDREGRPHFPLKIIEAGYFVGPLYNSLAANREEKETSGHAAGSYRSVPGIGPTNLILKGIGDKLQKVDHVIKNVRKGIIVTRFSGDVDPVSGYYSGLIKGGYYVEKGEIAHPIASVTIHGNIFENLNQIASITPETKRIGSWMLPELVELEQVEFASG